jgi:hypothetical protein
MAQQKVSASELQLYLKGIRYPADKQKLMEIARGNGAPENVVSVINRLPEKTYGRANEVQQEFGKAK